VLRKTKTEISAILKYYLTFWKFSANYRTYHDKNLPRFLSSKCVTFLREWLN
jgi:hypothetical protein